MALSDMKVFSGYVTEAAIETVAQSIQKFNEASNGAIILSSDGFDGDYMQRAMFGSLASAQRRVDRYATNAAVSATALAQIEDTVVKVAGGFGPIEYEPSQMNWLKKNEIVAIEAISASLANAILADQLNAAIACTCAALANVSALTYDDSAANNITQLGLNGSHALFGDRSQSLIATVISGTAYHKLLAAALANTATLFNSGTVTVLDILGKIFIVTDAAALSVTGTPNKGRALSLVEGGVKIIDTSDIVTNMETTNGKSRIVTTFQSDYTFGVGVKGFAWDKTNGGKSPTDAELATGTNWDKYVTSDKETAGTLLIYNADA